MSNASKTSDNLSFKVATIRDRKNSLDIRYGVQCASSAPERWLVLSNGRTEWLEKYASLGEDLGIAPTTGYMSWDHRGQGASGGARAWIDDYKYYAEDMADAIHAGTQGRPYNLVCHSMGGMIALTAIMDGLISPRCVVLSSPMLGLPHHPLPPQISYKLSRFAQMLGLGHVNTGGGSHWRIPFAFNTLTHSAERFEVIKNCPYPVPSATFEWFRASYEATQAAFKPERLKKLTMPILVLAGTDERVVDANAMQPWVSLAQQHASGPVELCWIQGGRHELLFESKPYYDQALAVIKQWFNKVGFVV